MHFPTLTWTLLPSLLPFATGSPLDSSRRATVDISTISLPTSSLPTPADSLTLKYVLLGVGTQNYTCASSTSTTIPVANGALADLFDFSPFLAGPTPLVTSNMQTVPPLALSLSHTYPQMFDNLRLKKIGRHFFAAGGVPTFDLTGVSPRGTKISGKKIAGTPAPAGACSGTEGEGAVDWLYLTDAGLGGATTSANLKGGAVYRVETAGGKAPATCEGQGADVVVPYTTEYWIYGS
ncbi:hypothetical protein K402DRAFT_338646 [Aulographum hederae CBS 113979]|uniref:Malate dehydrogenase n=1 Tax=Aulographum hederae CBS 113979 TaxID=1176131 RepID=A0A6G1GQM2_9PEZI|nr:hypothetical protein K402DRAFT_338646 [Aulographum hederae CBS 113979]